MCGIFGFAGPPDRQLLGRMAAALVHRGPDDAGSFETAAVSLGHRRLSIIDREGGHQPVANEDETVWLVYNGEVYNYRELRAELRGRGSRLPHAQRQRGHRPRLRGVGAGLRRALQRHVGVRRGRPARRRRRRQRRQARPEPRPLRHQAALLRALAAHRPAAVRQRDQGAAAGSGARTRARRPDALRVPAARLPRPPRRDVLPRRVPRAGGHLDGAAAGRRSRAGAGLRGARPARGAARRARAYWTPELRVDGNADPADFRRRFRESVERRLVSEVPVGSCLSGGLDSTTIVELHERAAAGGRARRGVAARAAQDVQRRVRRRPHRRARVHRDRRREHRRRHHVHEPHLARVHRRAARVHLAPGGAHRQHRPLRAVVRDAQRPRAGHGAAGRPGRRRAAGRLRAVPARVPAAAAARGRVRQAPRRGARLTRRALAAGEAAHRPAAQAPARCADCCGRRSSRASPTPGTGARRTTSRSVCSRTCSRTACRACCATRTATPWRSASRAACRTWTRSSWTTSSACRRTPSSATGGAAGSCAPGSRARCPRRSACGAGRSASRRRRCAGSRRAARRSPVCTSRRRSRRARTGTAPRWSARSAPAAAARSRRACCSGAPPTSSCGCASSSTAAWCSTTPTSRRRSRRRPRWGRARAARWPRPATRACRRCWRRPRARRAPPRPPRRSACSPSSRPTRRSTCSARSAATSGRACRSRPSW